MNYLSRKLTMPRLILPAPAVPERGRDAAWRESAACLSVDTELFFPVGFTGPAAAAHAPGSSSLCPHARPRLIVHQPLHSLISLPVSERTGRQRNEGDTRAEVQPIQAIASQ